MTTHSDLTFITNEGKQTLLERFKVLVEDTKFFDVLVGYFYTSGFHSVYESLENTKRVRILIGISTNRQTLDLIETSQQQFHFSHAETKEKFSTMLIGEMENAEDSSRVENGVKKFLEWMKSGKLEIKAYPTENIHAKLYIMSFHEDDRDTGRVITGSSNFTQSGLVDNLEFNVELKNRVDYEFAKGKFEELWKDAVDISDKYEQTIQEKTWLNDTIAPYHLYLKFLYEYFKDELGRSDEIFTSYLPQEFKKLEYQEQAVLNAKKILEEYGGVFLSDVVGLGKTYVSAMLAGQLDGRNLVLAPPVLLDANNPGSWRNVFSDFRVSADYESLGKLDALIGRGTERYKNVFIDEAHRFRTESNVTYEKLAQVCRGKRVILVTATPSNNHPKDILSQIKLFQNARKSTIPNVPDLESFFANLEKNTKDLDRRKDRESYMRAVSYNARKIRESVLKYLMVRRTRNEIERYFAEDLKNQKLKFPEIDNPEPAFYKLNKQESEVFNKTIQLIAGQLTYARYTPMLYYKLRANLGPGERQSQINMGAFMKILLVKRLESSFFAFRRSIGRFIGYYELFLRELREGNVYASKKHANKIFELLSGDNEEEIEKLLQAGKAKIYPAEDFTDKLKKDLEKDLETLKEIQNLWKGIERDPKLLSFVELLSTHSVLKKPKSKIVVFTESKETAHYLVDNLKNKFPGQVLAFSSESGASVRKKVIDNFDANVRNKKDDCRILIATEVLSEGVNLHRSNIVINYDIPWNPTRLMQRVGRINRVNTAFKKIYTFNFFPTEESNDQIKLKEAAEAKIHAFIVLLGADARLLTEGETIESHELFNRLISKKTITGEDDGDESELKYLQAIKNIRDKDPDLFEKVKILPKKARTARKHGEEGGKLLTYFRKGRIQKFFLTGEENAGEVDFIDAAKLLETRPHTRREKIPADFYDKLENNKEGFKDSTTPEGDELQAPVGNRSAAAKVLRILKAVMRDTRRLTDEQEDYYLRVVDRVKHGALPKQTASATNKALEKEIRNGSITPMKALAVLRKTIPDEFLESHIAESAAHTFGPREVILSEYLVTGRSYG